MCRMSQKSEEENSVIQVPLYCYHSKYFLVEELALNNNFCTLHYGRCSIIGKIAADSTDTKRFIENIRLPSLPGEYSLPEGSVRLLILTHNYRRRIPVGKVCEIFGDVILYNTVELTANKFPLTAKDVVERFIHLNPRKLSESEFNEQLSRRYQPAVIIDQLREVQKGAELVERNLELRLL